MTFLIITNYQCYLMFEAHRYIQISCQPGADEAYNSHAKAMLRHFLKPIYFRKPIYFKNTFSFQCKRKTLSAQ